MTRIRIKQWIHKVIYQGKLYNLAAFLLQTPTNSDIVIFNDRAASPATSLTHQGSSAKYAESVSSNNRLRLSKELKARIVPGFLTVTGDMLK